MKKETPISTEDFEALLNWLSADSEEAGIEYEKIRKALVRFFRYKGCSGCDDLADETINRVTLKVKTLDLSKNVKKITIFYGFATNIFREYLRNNEINDVHIEGEFPFLLDEEKVEVYSEKELTYLDDCLDELPIEERTLITIYFSKVKAEKINLRKKLAEEFDVTPNALHVRVYRIKQKIKNCILECYKKRKV